MFTKVEYEELQVRRQNVQNHQIAR